MESSPGLDRGKLSDGYHTFDELYEHRHTLFIALCNQLEIRWRLAEDPESESPVWRSKFHHDGTMYPDWFVMGIYTEPGLQITYHLPIAKWDDTYFARDLHRAPDYDGHTPADVLERLTKL